MYMACHFNKIYTNTIHTGELLALHSPVNISYFINPSWA